MMERGVMMQMHDPMMSGMMLAAGVLWVLLVVVLALAALPSSSICARSERNPGDDVRTRTPRAIQTGFVRLQLAIIGERIES